MSDSVRTEAGRALLDMLPYEALDSRKSVTRVRNAIAAIEAEAAAQAEARVEALREALRHIAYLGTDVPIGMQPEDFYRRQVNEAIRTATIGPPPTREPRNVLDLDEDIGNTAGGHAEWDDS